MADQVPALRTSIAPSQALALISSALEAELGREPSSAEIKIVLAQSALETDRWRAMWNWNFGNSVAAVNMPYFLLPQHAHHFRPFSSAWQGVSYFVALIRRRFTQAWQLLGAGDPVAFAYALKAQNYYEGSPEKYGALLASLYREFGASPASSTAGRSQKRSLQPAAEVRNSNDPAVSGLALLFLGWWLYRRTHQLS